jgi:hypothetical protein
MTLQSVEVINLGTVILHSAVFCDFGVCILQDFDWVVND